MGINGIGDILHLIEKTWNSIWGMWIVWFLEIAILIYANTTWTIAKWSFGAIFVVVLLPATYLMWLVSTGRGLQRVGYKATCLYFVLISVIGCYCFIIYPCFIAYTKYDIGGIHYWGTIIIVMLFGFLFYLYIRKSRGGLCIVFLVSNKSKNEEDIKQALIEARNRVTSENANIDIVIPPFGIVHTQKDCEEYINSWYNQADAIIFASLIDSPGNSEFGYAFTNFTSRMNNRIFNKGTQNEEDIKFFMEETYRCHDWNTLNINTDQISRQLIVAANLSHLFLMYVSCIYLQKHKYSDAIEVAERLYTFNSTGNSRYDISVKNLIAHSYVTAEQIEEQENKDYARAHEILEQCVQKLPAVKYTLQYHLALARLYFYEDNIRESKRVTRKVKESFLGAEWYVTINMAFYAIHEQKPQEVIYYYRKILKMPKPYIAEVDFAIRFQMTELENCTHMAYKMFLLHGLSFLYLYTDEKMSDKYFHTISDYASVNGYQELEDMRRLIMSSKGKLKTRK